MRLCAKGTDIVTDVWLAENYWKICLSQSFSRKTCIWKVYSCFRGEKKENSKLWVKVRSYMGSTCIHTSTHMQPCTFMKKPKEDLWYLPLLFSTLFLKTGSFPQPNTCCFCLGCLVGSSRDILLHFSAEGFWHIHPCPPFTWMLGIQTRSSCLASVLTHLVLSLALSFLSYIH